MQDRTQRLRIQGLALNARNLRGTKNISFHFHLEQITNFQNRIDLLNIPNDNRPFEFDLTLEIRWTRLDSQ